MCSSSLLWTSIPRLHNFLFKFLFNLLILFNLNDEFRLVFHRLLKYYQMKYLKSKFKCVLLPEWNDELNLTIFLFLVQTFVMGAISSIELECEFLASRGKTGFSGQTPYWLYLWIPPSSSTDELIKKVAKKLVANQKFTHDLPLFCF